jgi:hypothetical protein
MAYHLLCASTAIQLNGDDSSAQVVGALVNGATPAIRAVAICTNVKTGRVHPLN